MQEIMNLFRWMYTIVTYVCVLSLKVSDREVCKSQRQGVTYRPVNLDTWLITFYWISLNGGEDGAMKTKPNERGAACLCEPSPLLVIDMQAGYDGYPAQSFHI